MHGARQRPPLTPSTHAPLTLVYGRLTPIAGCVHSPPLSHFNDPRGTLHMSIKIGNRFKLEIAYGYFFARLPWGLRRGVRQLTLDLGYGHGNYWDKGEPGRDY